MKRLQTAEHILIRTVEAYNAEHHKTFFKPNFAKIDVFCLKDLRPFLKGIETKVNQIIQKNLDVKTYTLKRDKADVSLVKIPKTVKSIRIVEIDDFDKRACKGSHVDNTREIGTFVLDGIQEIGDKKYRFTFHVE